MRPESGSSRGKMSPTTTIAPVGSCKWTIMGGTRSRCSRDIPSRSPDPTRFAQGRHRSNPIEHSHSLGRYSIL